MANIHDPNTWGQFDDETKKTLLKIKELYIDDISQFKQEDKIQEEPNEF